MSCLIVKIDVKPRSVPIEAEEPEKLSRNQGRLLVVDDEPDASQKLKGRRQMRHALLPRRPDDEDVVEVEDASNPLRVEKRLERLGHQCENEGSDAEAEGENEIFVEEASPTEAEKPPEASIDTDVKLGVLQVYRRRPIWK